MLLCLGAPLLGVVADLRAPQGLDTPRRRCLPSRVALTHLGFPCRFCGSAKVWHAIAAAGRRRIVRRRAGRTRTLRLRGDGLRAGAAGLGLGLATGVAGLHVGVDRFLAAGVSVAAACAARCSLVQVFSSRALPAGFAGALSIGTSTALFAAGTLLLAELRWYALPLLLLVPAARDVARRLSDMPRIVRARSLVALCPDRRQLSQSWQRGSPRADRCSIDPTRQETPMSKCIATPSPLPPFPSLPMAAPGSYTLDPYHTFPNFTLDHLGVSTIYGRFNKTSGKLTIDRAARVRSIDLSVDTASGGHAATATRNPATLARRSTCARRTSFNAAEFPKMTFKSTSVSVLRRQSDDDRR